MNAAVPEKQKINFFGHNMRLTLLNVNGNTMVSVIFKVEGILYLVMFINKFYIIIFLIE